MRYQTPIRYPGGKQRLAGFISELMTENKLTGGHYVEPFAGGAGVAIDLLLSGKVAHIHLNDSAVPLYAFWRSVLVHTEEFCRRVASTALTVDEWRRQKEILSRHAAHSQIDVGFSFFYLNRCNRSGIVWRGSLIGGLDQSGKWKMDARFPRNELARRIEAIAERRGAITIKNWDAERFIMDYIPKLPAKTLVYCDPPYYRAGHLYLNNYNREDHARIAKLIQERLRRPWLVSYDNVAAVITNYHGCQFFRYRLQYNAATVYRGAELFVFSNKLRLPTASTVRPIDKALRRFHRRQTSDAERDYVIA
ncbi:MAG TPA: DNA adenine methylase [Polyangia bacterium]|nr:DNA adenine methylase [Polyangia bacterium]